MRHVLNVILQLLLYVGFCSVSVGFQPEVTGSIPRGMQRGTTQKVTLQGVRLGDGHQLLMDRPGLTVRSLKAVDDKNVELELEAPADMAPGLYPMRLVAQTGLSNVILFAVGAMPTVDEKEPNSDPASPQAIDYNVTVEGSITREDEDYYLVRLKQGQPLTVELEGVRLKKGRSNPFFDPLVAVLSSEFSELASSDDAPLLQQDCLCTIEAPADGDYLIMVRDSAYGGDNDRYRLHLGSFPRPIAVIPSGGPPGASIDVTCVAVSGDVWIEKVQLPNEPSDAFPLIVSNSHGVAPSPNFLRVQPMSNFVEVEPNNSYQEATDGLMPGAFCGIIGEPGDSDFFSFEAKKDQTIHLRLYARDVLRSALDGVVNVYNAKGARVGGNDDSGGPDSFLEYKVPADGTYYVGITDHLNNGSPAHAYRMEVKLTEPELTLTLPDRRRYEATQINIPQGNRAAVMINATRRGVAGPIDIQGLDLPVGVSLTPIQMPESQSTVPLLLSATPEAAIGGSLVQFVGGIPGDATVGRFTQRHQLLIGQNNNVVYDYDADRAAVAVINPLPCQLHIATPNVPIVRNGSMDLLVKIDRGGLDADVPIQLLYNPPGIGSSGTITIPKDQSEAVIPLTANESAAIGTWPLIAYAVVQGNEIASDAVMLEIAEKFLTVAIPKTSAELGKEASVAVDVEVNREFSGSGELEILGLPAGVTCDQPKVEFKHDTPQVVFQVRITETARVGQHKTLVIRATIPDSAGVITQTEGTGVLQIDKRAELASDPLKQIDQTGTAGAPKSKPLSRLEELRLLHQKKKSPSSP